MNVEGLTLIRSFLCFLSLASSINYSSVNPFHVTPQRQKHQFGINYSLLCAPIFDLMLIFALYSVYGLIEKSQRVILAAQSFWKA